MLLKSIAGDIMIGIISAVFIVAGTLYSFFTGGAEAVSSAVLSGGSDAVSFLLKTGGAICFFCGIMKIAEKAGLTSKIAKILRPLLSKIIPSMRSSPGAEEAVCMNVSSNLLGLGNAATPFGIKASKSLFKGIPDRSLASFVVLNTSSVQLIPSTVASIRAAAGSNSPFDILLPVLISQSVACAAGLIFVRIMFRE